MKATILTTILYFTALIAFGQERKIVIKKNRQGEIEYVKYPPQLSEKKQVNIPETALDFFKEYFELTPSISFIKQPQKQRNKDFVHEHYNQYYNEVKVDGRGYNFHFKKGKLYLAHGNIATIEGLNTTPSITKEEAKKAFARHKEIAVDEIPGFKSELLIKEISSITGIDTVYTTLLVFRVYLITEHPNNNEIGYIDAHSGKVLLTEPSMTGYSATGTFATRYNGTKQAITQYYNGTFNLCDSTRGAIIHTRDLNGTYNFGTATELTDSDNNWTSPEHSPNNDDMGLDVHWALQEIYDYFDDNYSINSYDDAVGQGKDINAYIHWGNPAYAGWAYNDDKLVFGNGGVNYNPYASLDIVAHEYGHGITQFQIGWSPTGDEATFQEGMSDIWAVILENGISVNSIWEMGEEVTINDDCIRNIQDPDDSNAETILADTYLNSVYNSGNEYVKSGIFSHWFYLLVSGETGTNDNNDNYTVYGIGMDAAEKLIVESVFNGYLDNTTTYPGIRTQTVDAAEEEFAVNSFQALQVQAAWYAVGVGTEPTQPTITGPDLICYSGSTYTANNSPTGSTIKWVTSNNLTVHSGQGTTEPTIRAKYSSSTGAGWVQANYVTGTYETPGPSQTVWVGAPEISSIDGPQGAPNNYWAYYTAELESSISAPTDYSWTLSPLNGNYVYEHGKYFDILFSSTGNYQLIVKAKNTCSDPNYGPNYVRGIYVYTSYYMVVSPNPATTEATISIEAGSPEETTLKSASTATAFDENTEWEYEVYSTMQNLKAKKTKIRGKSTTINTQGWKEGVYTVRAKYKGEVLTGKLVVKK